MKNAMMIIVSTMLAFNAMAANESLTPGLSGITSSMTSCTSLDFLGSRLIMIANVVKTLDQNSAALTNSVSAQKSYKDKALKQITEQLNHLGNLADNCMGTSKYDNSNLGSNEQKALRVISEGFFFMDRANSNEDIPLFYEADYPKMFK